jgi:Domain of unknwon function (DUF3824)
MPEITRERVVYRGGRDRDDDSDDDRSTLSRRESGSGGGYRTVQRYRVTPSRVEPVEDERRSSRTLLEVRDRRGDRLDIERTSDRFEPPARPRSAIDIRPRSSIVDRYVEREPLREPERSERTRTVVYDRDRRDPERGWDRDFGRESERDVRETDVRIEKRVTTERREEPYELERYQRETEYYDRQEPAPQPIVIRQRAPEPQKIILQEAPAPPPIYLPQPPREEGFQVIRRREEVQEVSRPEPRRAEDEYYYRRDVREVGGPRRSDEDFAIGAVAGPLAVAAYHDRREREIRPRDSVSDEDYSDGSDVVVKRRIIKKERSRSRDSHHKRHLAEGALAGAGAAAILANHRDKQGDGSSHRGRKVVGGAALGALGAEVLTRARSAYRESHDDDGSRSRSSSRHSHRKLKTGLALAAAGLAAAAAAKYVSNRKANAAEAGRGRSRTRSVSRRRYSDDDDFHDEDRGGRSRSRHADPKHRAAQMAKAGVATAAVAGIVEHFRNKSKKRDGSRSKSRIRTGAEIAAAGLAGAGVAGLYEGRKAKEDREEAEHEARRERRRSRSRSRARSVGAYSDPGVDPELGMVQYGTEPVYTHPNYYDPAVAAGAGAAYGATREHRSHRSHGGRRRHSSESSSERDTRKKSRSRSRVRDIAGVAAGTAAAAIGINQYKKRKEKKEAEREKERRREDPQHSRSRSRSRSASSIRSTLTKRLSNLIPGR